MAIMLEDDELLTTGVGSIRVTTSGLYSNPVRRVVGGTPSMYPKDHPVGGVASFRLHCSRRSSLVYVSRTLGVEAAALVANAFH